MALKLVTRAQWGARAPRGSYTTLPSTRGVKVHYTGGRVNEAMEADHGRCAGAVRGIQRGHMDGNGWIDIGYSMVVCYHGYVFVGRGPHRLPAANGAGLNTGHYAVLGLVGTSGTIVPSDAMLDGIRDAIDYLRDRGDAGREIKGHRDGYATACPGEKLYAWVRAGAPRPGGTTPPPPAAGKPWPGHYYQLTSPMTRGANVKWVQERLNAKGASPKLATDGVFGPKTDREVRDYQKAHNLDVDGIVGPRTWASLAK